MIEVNKQENEEQNKLQEIALNEIVKLENGSFCKGTIVQIYDNLVFVDIGYKSEGQIPLDEFNDEPIEVGKVIDIKLINKDSVGGPTLSFKEVRKNYIEKTIEEGQTIQGTVTKVIKGGYSVNLGADIQGFVPTSQIDTYKTEDPSSHLRKKYTFIVKKKELQNSRLNIVLSRRDYLMSVSEENLKKFFSEVSLGDIVEGTVKNFTPFGAFIDLGLCDALLHVNDITWGNPTSPKDYLKRGEVLKLKVISLDETNKRINLSLKELQDNPWDTIDQKYHEGEIKEGIVTKLFAYGAFVLLEESIEGLVHISELSWLKKVGHPKEILNVGDKVQVKVLRVDKENHRISLGIKQTLPNPWDSISERYPIGTKLTLTPKNVIKNGIFFEVEEGIDGFLHIDDISWNGKNTSLKNLTQNNESIEVVVTKIVPEKHRLQLGIKQLTDNPWEHLKNLGKKAVIEGTIISKTDFGVFVKVQGDLEGLIHKNDLVESPLEDVEDTLKKHNIGDKVKAVIKEVQPEKNRLSFSVKNLHHHQEQKEIDKYIEQNDNLGTYSLGHLLDKLD